MTANISNKSSTMLESVFVSAEVYLREGGGGVQWCTREYLETIKGSQIVPNIVAYRPPRDLFSRVSRRLSQKPYQGLHDRNLAHSVLSESKAHSVRWIFMNNTDATALAVQLRELNPSAQLVSLSHGVEITDVVNNLRIAPENSSKIQKNSHWLGELLKTEIQIRSALDATICISEEDVAFEKWLGTPKVLFIPRQIQLAPIDLAPQKGRVGTVATLDHGPNLHGIRVFAAAARCNTKFRVIGGPESIGKQLENEFPSIAYCGRLADDELKREVSTWCAFVNPIFCHARGASTKVATALGWGLPVFTTRIGARGYRWNESALPLPETPEGLADLCDAVANSNDIPAWQQRAMEIVALAPKLAESSEMLRNFLLNLPS